MNDLNEATEQEIESTPVEAVEVDEPENLEAPINDEPELEGETPEQDEQDDGEEGEGLTPEMAVVKINGQEYEVPAEIRDNFLMQADYTQKTQAVAEMRRDFEARIQAAQQINQASNEEMQLRARAMQLHQTLEQYDNVDWRALDESDPMGANTAFREYQMLREEFGQIGQKMQQLQGYRQQQEAQLIDARLKETADYAKREIPNWSPELDNEITQFATQELGHNWNTLVNTYNPAVYRTLYLAHLGHQALTRSQNAKPQPSRPKAKPMSKVNARGNVPSGPVETIDDMDAYAAKRKQQMGLPT